MRIAKRILSICLTFLVATTLLSALACVDVSAAISGKTGKCEWRLDGTVLTISGKGYISTYNDFERPWGTEVTKIIIEDGVTDIPVRTFYNHNKVTSVSIGNTVEYISGDAFAGCVSLTSIQIPDGVKSIHNSAFSRCTGLRKVKIGAGTKGIDDGAFEGCEHLYSIEVDSENQWYKSANGVLYSKDKTELILYPPAKSGDLFIVPDTVKTICYAAFVGNLYLKKVVIPQSVTSIGHVAFNKCQKLKDVVMMSNFGIYSHQYSGCKKIENLYIPKDICYISCDAFTNCGESMNIYYEGSRSDQITIDYSTHNNGDCTFCNAKWHFDVDIEKQYEQALSEVNHRMGSWEVGLPASCTQKGEMVRYCKDDDCTYKETKETKAIGHDYSKFVINKKATCTKDGERIKTCSNCGDIQKEIIKTSGHTFGEWVVTKEPTCAKIGKMERTCTVCNAKKEEDTIDRVSHTFDDYVVIKQATAEENGIIEGKCTVCGKKAKQMVTIGGEAVSDTENTHTHDAAGEKRDNRQWYIPAMVITATVVAVGAVVLVLFLTRKKK